MKYLPLSQLLPSELEALEYNDKVSACYSCNQVEFFTDEEPYIVCFECGHIYQTADDLQTAFARWSFPIPAADKIFFCQHCIHDF